MGGISIVQGLIDWGANINATTTPEDGGKTPLMFACEEMDIEMIELLLCYTDLIDVGVQDSEGRTASDIVEELNVAPSLSEEARKALFNSGQE